jgi:chromosome segregation ATPase
MKRKHQDLLKVVAVLFGVFALSVMTSYLLNGGESNKFESKIESSEALVNANIEALSAVNDTMQSMIKAVEENEKSVEENAKSLASTDGEVAATKARLDELEKYLGEVDARLDDLASFVFPKAVDPEDTNEPEVENSVNELESSELELEEFQIEETPDNVEIIDTIEFEEPKVKKKRNPIQKMTDGIRDSTRGFRHGIKRFFSKIL